MDPTDTPTDDAKPLPPPALDLGEIEARLMVADRLAEFRANVLASLGLDADDLPTLRSVLDGQLVCEREVAEPVPRRAPLPLTVRRAMTLAANTGVKVVLSLSFKGEAIRHVCNVVRRAQGGGSAWIVEPPVPEPADIDMVQADQVDWHSPFVVSCEPVPKGLAIVPEGEGS